VNNNPKVYLDKIEQLTQEISSFKLQLNQLVVIRLSLFVASILSLYFFYDYNLKFAWGLCIAFFLGFLFLVKRFERIKREKDFSQVLKQINQTENEALKGDFSNLQNGKEFENPTHPFASDFDLFGDKSVFQFLNRSYLTDAKVKMATNLTHENLNQDDIKAKQKAIQELSNLIDFRQKIHAYNFYISEGEGKTNFLKKWATTPTESLINGFTKLAIWVFPIISFSVLFLQIFDFLTISIAIYFYITPLAVIGFYLKVINQQHGDLGKAESNLEALEKVLHEIENQSFKTNYLKSLMLKVTEPQKSSLAIKDLKTIAKFFDSRSNIIVGILLNVFLLWDIRLSFRFEKWKKKHGASIHLWIDVLAEFEYLASLSNFRFNYPNSVFPQLYSERKITAKKLGHPLILEKRVDNDVEIVSQKHMVILTGANMAGKSTFLRTLGVNMVLAMMGAPVIAESFKLKPTKIFSGMRTADSLQENASYFFAELKRLSAIVQQLEKGEELFVILDEILKGTNSKDKEEGSIKLIKRLLNLNAGGIIATHDLGLCNLEKEFPQSITNMAFETEIKDNELHFDYKIKKGICQTMNASFLIEKMGITHALN